jgi:hypothetical protein
MKKKKKKKGALCAHTQTLQACIEVQQTKYPEFGFATP